MANGLDEFNLQLSGELDQQQSKKNINDDIATLERAIEHLKVQAEIDPNSVKNIAKQLSDILNQKVVVDNIQIDATKVSKTAQQVGQKIGDAVEKSVQQSLSIDDVIDKQVTNLMAKYSIAGKKGSKAFEEIRQAVVNYRQELASVDSAFDSDDIFDIFSNSADIRKVTSALADHMKVADATKDTYASLAEYIKHVNNSGTKIHLPESIRQEYGDDFSSMRNQLGKAFTTGHGGDFESFITELNGQLGNVIDMSQGAEAAFGDLVQKVNSAKGGNFLSGNELFTQGYLDRDEIERDITSAINIIEEEEKKLAQVSTSTANTVVQNEEKKQQAYQQTAKAQKQVAESESLIKSGANVTTFDHTTNAAREASAYFKQLLEDENAVISVSERFGQLNGLTSFTVNVKRATGEVESLRYALKPILDSDGNETGEFYFGNVGAELNNSGAIKQIQAIENAFTDYTAKLAQFKSTNTNILSGLTQPLADFESKLAGLKNGTVSIDEVKNAFKLLGTEASKITENFTGQLSKTDAAIRKLSQGDEIMDGLKASFKGLSNAPKDINTELNKVSKLLREVRSIESQEGRTANWSAKYREWSDEVDKLKAKLSVLQKQQASMTTPQIFKTSDLKSAGIPYMQKVSNTIEKQMVEIQRMAKREKFEIIDTKGVQDAEGKIKTLTLTVRDAEGTLKRFEMQRAKLQGSGKAQTGLMQVGDVKVLETASQAQAKLAQQTENANVKLQEQVNKIQHSWSDSTYEAKYDSLIAKTKQWVNANDESVISTQKLTTAYNEFNTAASNFAKDGSSKNRDILIQKEEELGRQLKATTNDIKVQNAEWAKSSKVDSLHQKIQEFYDKNTATHRTWGSQLKNMLNETAHGAQVTATRVKEIEQEFLGVSNAARQAGKLGQSFFGSIKEQASKFVQWFSVTSVVMEGVQAIKKMTQEVIAVDSAMVELRKVSDASNNDLKNYFDEAAKSAKDLGAAVSDVISATADWSRLGYSLDDSKKLAEVAILYKNVGDGIDVDTANESLVSTLRGFQLSAEDAMNIVDQFNEVANNFPIDSAGIGEALQRSAASFYEANTDLSKSIALITGTNSVIQDPDSVGTMWKTVSMRIRGATAELEEAGLETEGMVETTSQLQSLVKGMTGFDIMKDEDTFKDIYEIVIGIGNEWQNLSDIEQASLLEALAGKRQGNALAAALNNISMIEDAYNTSTNSAGSALEEQEEYEKGIQYSLDRLEAKFQEFSNHVLESELIKGIVDFGTTTLDVIDKVTSALGSLGTIGVIGGGILGAKNAGREKCYPSYRICL